MRRFRDFACVDWSGALGERLPSLAVAVTQGSRDVRLLERAGGWSRAALADWLAGLAAAEADMLIGLDLSMGFPFVDSGAYFPGWHGSPEDAPALWALVDALSSADPHLSVPSFLSHPDIAAHFRERGRVGHAFAGTMGRLRQTEHGQAAMGLRPYSCFNLVGAAQVGKSSLTGMRVLHRLRGVVPVWPFDPLPPRGPVIVEIYTSLAALAAGRAPGRSKMRDLPALSAALSAFDARAEVGSALSDHAADALVTAAWLRRHADNPALWGPRGMTQAIAATEGWTFGVA